MPRRGEGVELCLVVGLLVRVEIVLVRVEFFLVFIARALGGISSTCFGLYRGSAVSPGAATDGAAVVEGFGVVGPGVGRSPAGPGVEPVPGADPVLSLPCLPALLRSAARLAVVIICNEASCSSLNNCIAGVAVGGV